MNLLAVVMLALLLGAFGSGFLIKGVMFSLGILAGVELVRWAKRRQARMKMASQVIIDLSETEVAILSGTILHYTDHWEFIGGYDNKQYFSYDQGATWTKAEKL